MDSTYSHMKRILTNLALSSSKDKPACTINSLRFDLEAHKQR